MGTRADFYLRRGKEPLAIGDWLGSIAFDGYPEGIPKDVLQAKNPEAFLAALETFAKECDHWTSPADGWPWPWKTSETTDYAYVFSNSRVTYRKAKYPDMTSVQKVTLGKRSGLMVFST